MPEKQYENLRALYEIAVSIGGSLDLEIMARAALFAYHRKLGCVASSLINDTPSGSYIYCSCGKGSRIHKPLLEELSTLDRPNAGQLLIKTQDQEYQTYVFELPDFGALALTVNGKIPTSILKDLTALNLNFASACIACVQNQGFRQAEIETRKALTIKTEFLSNISHELRTPMNAVIGFSNLLQRNTQPHRVAQYAERILASADLLMALINDMLDFNTVEQKAHDAQMLSFHLEIDVLSHLHPLQKLAQVKGLEMTIELSQENESLEVVTNGKRLSQVLTKITENAVKFCAEGDSIHITCDINRENASTSGTQLLIFSIADTGPGIPDPLIPNLFEPFHQGDNSIKRAYQGAGLGLALCKKIVTQAGGEIALLPSDDGCQIQFTWPCLLQQAQPQKKRDLRTCRFLVVDDNQVNREVLKAILTEFGTAIDTANNGLEAINACQSQQYDLIFMDCHMPIMNGMDATRIIRSLGSTYRKVPVIAVTADVTSKCNQECLAAGMTSVLHKPMLKEAVAKATQQIQANWSPVETQEYRLGGAESYDSDEDTRKKRSNQ